MTYNFFNGPVPAQSTGATVLSAAELSPGDWVVIISDTPTLTITTLADLAQFILAGSLPSGASGLTATGTTQATAFPIAAVVNIFGTVPANAGCLLPGGYSSPIPIQLVNNGANPEKVYPFFGDQIAGYGVNAPAQIESGGGAVALACFDPITQAQPRTWWIVA